MGSNHKCTSLVRDVANGGDDAYVEAVIYEKSLSIPLNFAVNLTALRKNYLY